MDGSIVAWGCGGPYDYGQCNVPIPNANFVSVAAGFRHNLGLKGDGSIVAWGWNGDHQCNVPAPNGEFVGIAAGYAHSLGLKAPQPCDLDVDCDDGRYCNGAEDCNEGACLPGTPIDCDDGVNCTDDSCDEIGDTCVHATNDGLCDDGLFCTGVETCDELAGCLTGTYPCAGLQCDEANDRCYCLDDGECPDGDVCAWGHCAFVDCELVPNLYGDVSHNGFITLVDLFCVLDGFAGNLTDCSFEDDDIHGSCGPGLPACCPNGVISLGDLFSVLDAFAGEDPCCGT